MRIEPCADLKVFFRSQLSTALVRRRIEARPETADYVAGVLVQCGLQPPATLLAQPLVLSLSEALSSESTLRLHRLQVTGDAALCLAGIFAPHVERTQGTLELYVHVGALAYQKAAETAREVAAEPGPVAALTELGEAFPRFVDALQEVAAASALGSLARDAVRLYDRVRRAGSERAAEEMARQGIFPAPGAQGPC
jgi:hypothetical protein